MSDANTLDPQEERFQYIRRFVELWLIAGFKGGTLGLEPTDEWVAEVMAEHEPKLREEVRLWFDDSGNFWT